jgi:hypothetical protein
MLESRSIVGFKVKYGFQGQMLDSRSKVGIEIKG